jgi:O-antigen ligase
VISFSAFLASARAELPGATFARWASIFFSLSVLTFLLSLAAAQAFLALAAACYAVYLLRQRPAIHFPPVKLPLALFSLGTVVSVLWAANPTVGWFAVRKLVLFVVLLLGVNLVASSRHLEFLYQSLFAESALAGLVAIGQFVLQYRQVRALHPAHLYASLASERISGFMGHWMNFGGQQMLVFAALLAFLLLRPGIRGSGFGTRKGDSAARSKPTIWWLLLVVIATSIVLNLTRGVWLGCFVATLYLMARWKPRWLLLLPALVVVGYFAAPPLVRQRIETLRHPSRDPALSIRFEMWQVAWRMMQKHPLVGVGPNNIEQVYVLYLPAGKPPEPGYHGHLHNNFFQFGAERGLPVLAAWVWFMGALGWHFWRMRCRLARGRWVAEAAFAGWLAMLVEGCFEFNFGTSPVLMLFLFVVCTPFVVEGISGSAEKLWKVES